MENIFLTDERRELLEGNDRNLNENSLSVAKSRIRTRSRMALDELIEVADSGEIENSDVFEPKKVDRLVSALVGHYGLVPDPDHITDDVPDDYQNALLARLGRILMNMQFDQPGGGND